MRRRSSCTSPDLASAPSQQVLSGTLIRTGGRSRKDVAGYDLRSLLVGSEGTLAVITEVVAADPHAAAAGAEGAAGVDHLLEQPADLRDDRRDAAAARHLHHEGLLPRSRAADHHRRSGALHDQRRTDGGQSTV